jgi:nucleoside-diphosphate-sugar epimerase
VNPPILVTGGSGTLGRGVVARLLTAGHAVRVLSRRPRPADGPVTAEWMTGDLLNGDGLADAVAGVGRIVHCAGDPRRPRVDVDGTRNLLQAALAAGTPDLVYRRMRWPIR